MINLEDCKMTLVADLLKREVVTCKADCPVEELMLLMRQHAISGLPVVDDAGELIGIVSASDIMHKQAGIKAGDLMTTRCFHVSSHTTVRQAANLMASERIHRLIVTSGHRKVVGVLSSLDLVEFLSQLPIQTMSTL